MTGGIDIIAALLLLFFTTKGLFDGFIKQIISIASLAAAIYCAIKWGPMLGESLLGKSADPLLVKGMGWLLCGIGVLVVTNLLGRLLCKVIHITPFGALDRMLGGLLAFLGGSFVLGALWAGWEKISPYFIETPASQGLSLLPHLAYLFRTIIGHRVFF